MRCDWKEIKKIFLGGPWQTIAAFIQDQRAILPKKDSTILARTIGWEEEKKGVVAVAQTKVSMSAVHDQVGMMKKLQKRHVKMARLMQDRGSKALETLEPMDTEEARKLVLTGMEQERMALGIGIKEKGGTQNLTQVNVNLPKTKFDEILDGQDLEGLLKLIAAIRQEKARRAGRIGTGSTDQK